MTQARLTLNSRPRVGEVVTVRADARDTAPHVLDAARLEDGAQVRLQVVLAQRLLHALGHTGQVADVQRLLGGSREFGVAIGGVARERAHRLGAASEDQRSGGGELVVPEVQLVEPSTASLL